MTTANGVVVFSSNGGLVVTGAIGDRVRVRIRLVSDPGLPGEMVLEQGAYDIVNSTVADTQGRWSFSVAAALPAGSHHIVVDATLIVANPPGLTSPRVWVSGDATDFGPNETWQTHGTLTAVVVKQ